MKNLALRMLFILITSSVFMYSCIEDNFDLDKLSDQIELRPAFVVPVATGTLTLANAIKPGENVVYDPDNLVRIIFREDSVIYIQASELLEIPLQDPVAKVFNLNPIILDDFEQERSILLGELKDNMESSLKNFFEVNDGSNAVFPSIGPVAMGSYNVDLIEDFEYVYFSQGTLEVTLTNSLPVRVTITAEIRNQSDNSLVGSVTFTNLGAGATSVQSINLAGIRVNSGIRLSLANFQTPGSSPSEVLINLNDDLMVEVAGYNLKVDRGRAFIPDQVVETEDQFVNIELDDNEQLFKIKLSQGKIAYEVSSVISDGLYLSVVLPETRRNNLVVEYLLELQQGGVPVSGQFDLAGTTTDLTKDPAQNFNRLPVNYEVGIKSSGEMITFDLTGDDVNFTYTIEDIDFSYVEGWLGQKAITVDNEVFDFENEVNDFYEKFSGEIRLTNPMVRLVYENFFGVPVRMNFNMTGYGKEGEIVALNPPAIDFPAPSDTLQGAYEGLAEVNRDNSNIVNMIAIPPQRIEFSGSANANPGGTPATNFVKGNSYFLANLEVDVPLELQINNLNFSDTLEFDLGDDLDMIEDGSLHFIVENGFPFEVKLELIMRDSVTNEILHSFSEIKIMDAAPVNTNGVVEPGQKTVSTEKIELTRVIIDKMIMANQLIISATMFTSESGTRPVKIHSDYELKFNIRVRSSLIIN
jgi:hypothetical protein